MLARYVKGEYTYDASVTQMLRWESLESQREQFSIIDQVAQYSQPKLLVPPEYIPKFYLQIYYSTNYRQDHAMYSDCSC